MRHPAVWRVVSLDELALFGGGRAQEREYEACAAEGTADKPARWGARHTLRDSVCLLASASLQSQAAGIGCVAETTKRASEQQAVTLASNRELACERTSKLASSGPGSSRAIQGWRQRGRPSHGGGVQPTQVLVGGLKPEAGTCPSWHGSGMAAGQQGLQLSRAVAAAAAEPALSLTRQLLLHILHRGKPAMLMSSTCEDRTTRRIGQGGCGLPNGWRLTRSCRRIPSFTWRLSAHLCRNCLSFDFFAMVAASQMMAGAPASPRSKGGDRKVATAVDSVPVTQKHATVDVSERLYNPGGPRLR